MTMPEMMVARFLNHAGDEVIINPGTVVGWEMQAPVGGCKAAHATVYVGMAGFAFKEVHTRDLDHLFGILFGRGNHRDGRIDNDGGAPPVVHRPAAGSLVLP